MDLDQLAHFALDAGLLSRFELEPGGVSGEERMVLLDRARQALARAAELSLEDAGRVMHEAALNGDLVVRSGNEFAVVSCWGRLLAVMTRWELRGICHPDSN